MFIIHCTKTLRGKLVEVIHALLSESSCMHWQSSTPCPTWIYISPGQMREEGWPSPRPLPLVSKLGSHGFGRDQFWIWSGSLRIPSLPPGTHNYNPKRHNLIEGVSRCMISRQEAQANLVSIMKLKYHTMNFTLMAPILNQNGETTCRPLSKGLQHRLCCWGYSHHFGTGLLPGHGPSSPWFSKK